MRFLTIIESSLFSKAWPDYWTKEEHEAFTLYLAQHPDAGDVVAGSGGCRKVRWGREGGGKRGGVRVIYTVHLASGALVALIIYGKGATENIPAHVLREIAKEMGHAPQ